MIFFRTVFSFQVHKFQKDCCQANMHIVCYIDHNIVFTTCILNHCSATYIKYLMIVVFIYENFVFCVYCKYISHREQTWLFIYHLWPACFNCCKSSEFSVKNLCVLNVTVPIGWSVTNCMFYMLQPVRFIYNNLTDVPL